VGYHKLTVRPARREGRRCRGQRRPGVGDDEEERRVPVVVVLGLVRHRGAVRERRAHRRAGLRLGQVELPGLRTTGSRGLTLELSTAPVGVRSLARELDRVRRRRNRQRHQCRDDQCQSPAAHGEATANASTTYRFRVFHVGYSALLASWHSTPRAQVGEAKG